MPKRKELSRDRDYFTSDGAMRLAQAVERYWWGRGHDEVVAWVEVIPMAKGLRSAVKRRGEQTEAYAVRSNLVGGLPPRQHHKLAA